MVSTTTSIDTDGVNLVILIGEVTSPPSSAPFKREKSYQVSIWQLMWKRVEFLFLLRALASARPRMLATTCAWWASYGAASFGRAPA